MKRHLPSLLSVILLSSVTAFGQFYVVDDNCVTPFEDISSTGTALGLLDDDVANVTMPFSFAYYDIISDAVRIGNNGGIRFNTTSGGVGFANSALPTGSFGAFIAPYWDNLYESTGDVYHQTLGVAPFRRFIVQWDDRTHFDVPGSATFQVILYESTNEVRFVYDDLDFGDSGYNDGASATIGLQKTSSIGQTYSFNSSIAGTTCILFTPSMTFACQDVTVQLDGSGAYSFTTPLVPQTDASVATADGSTTNTFHWQSFTPTVSAILDKISVTFATAPATPFLDIYVGQGTGGTLLYSQAITGALTGSPTAIDIETVLDLTGSTEYTFVITDGGPFALQRNGANPYAGGVSSVGVGTDLRFSLDLLQRPDVDNGSMALAGLDHWDLSQSTFDCSDAGVVPVTLTVHDKIGNSGTCISNVTVEDNEVPVAVCQNISVNLNGSGNATILASALNGGSTDNCPTFTYSATQTAFNCGDVGANSVTLTVEDPSGNTDDCTATVTVNDVTPPSANCQNFIVVLNGAGSASIVAANINNGSTDNCGIASRVLDITDFTCGDLGPNTVELTVQDVNGLSSSCTATVTVQDNANPVITCPSDITLCSTSSSGAVATYAAVTATDNCTFTISQTDGSGLTSGSTFPIGTTAQSWSAVDIASNTVSCSFNVIVNASPTPDFTYSAACQGEAIFFSDASTVDPSTSIDSWNWNMDDGSGPITLVDPIHSFADLGTYNVTLTVETVEGCSGSASQAVTVTPVPTASFTFVAACEGGSTVFTNTSTIASGTLSHSWDFGDGNTSSTLSPSNIYALDGTYTVTLTVTSTDGCDDVTTAFVTVNDSPTALFSATTVCEGASTSFTNLSTGDGVLSYSWDFGDSNSSTDANPTHTYAADGVYTVTLTTTNGNSCVDTHTANVTVNTLPTADFTFSDGCEGTTSNFVNTSTSGTYTWDLGDGSSSTLTDVNHVYDSFGFYDVTLNVTSAQFCISSVTQTIEIFDLPDFSLSPSDVLCFGEATGSIVATPLGSPTGPWTLSLNGLTPQASLTFNGLQAGPYDVTVFDGNGCEFTVQTTVGQPSAPLTLNNNDTQNVLCHGTNSGSITVQGTGGTSPYSYSVDGGLLQPTGVFSGLDAGNHIILVVDDNDCEFTSIINLSEPDTLVLVLGNANDLLCNGDNSGSIMVNGTGGVTDYQYNLNGGLYGASNMFAGLAAATYIVGVQDANGCTDTLHVTLSEPGILQLSLISSQDADCFGQLSGNIVVAAASGTAPYQYSLNPPSFQGSGTFEGLGAGTYTVTARDENGCLDNLTQTIFEPSELTIETNSTPVACFGESTGEIEIIASGGTTAYEYSINEGVSFFANGGNFNGIGNGNYIAVVRDANGCTASEGVIISQPSSAFSINANVTNAGCLGQASGAVLLVGSGGTPTYIYSSDNTNFVASNSFSGFAAGQHPFYAIDLNGCEATVLATVGEPSTAVNINTVLLANPACPNQASGTATVQANGGTPGYTYSSNGGSTFQSGQILAGLNGGNHLIVVMDANGCTDTDTITLVNPPLLDIVVNSIVGIPCENNFTGEIHVTAEGGTPSYNYFLNGGSLQTNGDYTNLASGSYVISILDVNGCSYAETFSIVPSQLLPTADFTFNISGTAVLFTSQSEFGTEYVWDFGDGSTSTEENPVHVYGVDGDYMVTLTVTNICGSESTTILVSTTTIGINDNETLSFGVYPNPASTELFLQPNGAVPSDLNIDIISTTGQFIQTFAVSKLDASGRIRIDVQGLADGIYYLRAIGNEQQSVVRFDIIK
jgi:PKD repeat protein